MVLPADWRAFATALQRNPVEKQSGAAAYDGSPRLEGRPRKTDSRRDVVGIGVDRLQELKVVAQAGVQGQFRAQPSTRPACTSRRWGWFAIRTVSPKVWVKPALL